MFTGSYRVPGNSYHNLAVVTILTYTTTGVESYMVSTVPITLAVIKVRIQPFPGANICRKK